MELKMSKADSRVLRFLAKVFRTCDLPLDEAKNCLSLLPTEERMWEVLDWVEAFVDQKKEFPSREEMVQAVVTVAKRYANSPSQQPQTN